MRPRAAAVSGWAIANGVPIAACAALAMLLAWRLGQDASWDLRHYHFYTPHLLVGGRFARDFEPAGVQTYFNPILDLPFYLGVKVWGLRPLVVSLAHAAFHGLNLWLVYRLVRLLFPMDPLLASIAAPMAAVTGALGAAFSMEVGSTPGDATMSVFVLAALVVLLAGVGPGGSPAHRSVGLAGLLVGLAAGAKLVAAMYVVGLLAVVIVVGVGVRDRVVRVVSFGAWAAVGVLITYGYWMWLMFRHFGSPLFPFFDASLHSPYAAVTQYLANRFMPRTAAQALFYPFYFVTEQALVMETSFADARFAVAFVAVAVFAGVAVRRRWRQGRACAGVGDVRILAFVVFAAISYVVWQRYSSIYRYAVALELTAAVVLTAVAFYCLRSTVATLTLVVPACLLLVASTRPLAVVRVPWAGSQFGVDEHALSPYAGATILMWDMPNAYVVPYFPPSTTFLRIQSNWPYAFEPASRQRLRQRIDQADPQRLYLLDLPQAEQAEKARSLQGFGLALDPTRCQPFASLLESGRLCRVVDARQVAPPVLAALSPTVPDTYEGYHDITNCDGIMGWAWDRNRPDAPLDIDVYDGTRLLTRVTANQLRLDLLKAGKGNGRHGFTMPTSSDLRDGRPHDISMKFAGSLVDLHNGPRQIVCAAPIPSRE